ncbi:MAG: hypothetical protein EZS28_007138 [Streblomastix strix]|uniref:Uncharacterized protein n=1 Tax=Streblomastix strix TaxID=222440 RepID=A0A5J4WRC6_9EUKA|nr:MAG: hypothetical protein EZS28_007138 [Streblomastix strix]
MKCILTVQLKDHPRKVVTVVQIVFISFAILVDSVSVEESAVIIVMDIIIHLVGVFMDIVSVEKEEVMQSTMVSVVEIAIRMVIILVSYVKTIMDQVEVGLDPDFGTGIGAGRDTGIY